ncbi:hypothetical protein AB4304_09260, partial [Vibrio breoganii]
MLTQVLNSPKPVILECFYRVSTTFDIPQCRFENSNRGAKGCVLTPHRNPSYSSAPIEYLP